MGTLRNRIAYRRATEQTAPLMADVREEFSKFGDQMEALFSKLRDMDQLPLDGSTPGEFARCVSMMLTNLELASRDAIKAVLLVTGTPIDNAPAELHRRID